MTAWRICTTSPPSEPRMAAPRILRESTGRKADPFRYWLPERSSSGAKKLRMSLEVRDVPIGEEIPSINEGLGVVLLLFVERCHEAMQRLGINGEQVRSQSGVGPYARSADECAGFAFGKQLAAEAVK